MDHIAGFESAPKIAVAVSGGSDSMALCHLLSHWVKERGGILYALTVHHHLREEATTECEHVAHWMTEWNIPHTTLDWNHDTIISNLQAHARENRYRLLREWCTQHGILHLALGHHQEDQAETFTMRLERGSGLFGLSAMPITRYDHDVRLIRPLLMIPKISLQDYLKEHHIPWLEDPSNHQSIFTRVRHRKEALNIPNHRLAATANHLMRARDWMTEELAQAAYESITLYPWGMAKLKRNIFNSLHPELAMRLLASLLQTIGGQKVTARYEKLASLYTDILKRKSGKKTLAHTILHCKQDSILLHKEAQHVEQEPIALDAGESIYWDQRFDCRLSTTYSGPKVEIVPFCATMDNHASLLQTPKEASFTLPAFKILDSLIAVPHIGYYDNTMISKPQLKCAWEPYKALTESWMTGKN